MTSITDVEVFLSTELVPIAICIWKSVIQVKNERKKKLNFSHGLVFVNQQPRGFSREFIFVKINPQENQSTEGNIMTVKFSYE